MTNILDTVEAEAVIVALHGDPEAFGERDIRMLINPMRFPYDTKFYSRETVESLLAQTRKQVLLEAAALADQWGEARNPDNGGYALRNYGNELRRMAEGDKE